MTAVEWGVAVLVFWCVTAMIVAWIHHVHRRNAIDLREEANWTPISQLPNPRIHRPGTDCRPQVSRRSDGGRP